MADINEIIHILKCPKTGLDLKRNQNYLETETGIQYEIKDGIIDLVADAASNKQNEIQTSYNAYSKNKYDKIIKNQFFLKTVWGVTFKKLCYFNQAISDFSEGLILDIPCGTAFFGSKAYQAKPDCLFIALDYSMGMLRTAQKRCKSLRINNVVFIRGDVSNLPFKDHHFDGCFSLNGFHAFPNPQKGAEELGRIMKPKGKLLMTVACSKARWFSDIMINKVMIPRGFFRSSLPMIDYKKMLESSGFRDFQIQMFGAIMFTQASR